MHTPFMNKTVTLDKAGRVVIPKALRDELRLEAGDVLQLASEGDSMTLRPVRSASALRKERGVWVFRRGGGELAGAVADQVLEEIRESRDREAGGLRR